MEVGCRKKEGEDLSCGEDEGEGEGTSSQMRNRRRDVT